MQLLHSILTPKSHIYRSNATGRISELSGAIERGQFFIFYKCSEKNIYASFQNVDSLRPLTCLVLYCLCILRSVNFFFLDFFVFLGLHPWHMEVPRLGRGLVGAVMAGLRQSHSNGRSKPCL